jgi:DNA-directed RNA polymerase specialized sigma24 family protein
VNREGAERQIDDLLLRFINAPCETESEALLEQLICHQALPLITNIVGFKLRASSWRWYSGRDGQEAEDVSGEVILKLIRLLRDHKSSPEDNPIESLRSYVAVMAYNASDAYLRKKYPRRSSLKNKVKYILTHQPGLALWEAEEGTMLCGLASWRHEERPGPLRLDQDGREMNAFLLQKSEGKGIEHMKPADQIAGVCEFAGYPLEIDDLVNAMADVWGVRDAQPEGEWDAPELDSLPQLSPDPVERLDATLDQRARIKQVWSEMVKLPVRQRAALLLNLRDDQGGSAIAMLPLLKIASIQEIADALEMPAQELAALWNELPLEDAVIAGRLGATRQQVSNLRKCARERLLRRLGTA